MFFRKYISTIGVVKHTTLHRYAPLTKLTKPDRLIKHAYKFSMDKPPVDTPLFYQINPIHGISNTLEYFRKVQ